MADRENDGDANGTLDVDHLAIGIRGSDQDARAVLAQFADEVLGEV